MDESRIIELYAKYDNCRQVAEELGTSNETVRRVLIKNGIKRTGNRQRQKPKTSIRRPSNCSTKYCAPLVAMLYDILCLPLKEIHNETGIPVDAANNIMARKYPELHRNTRHKYHGKDIDAIEREYLAGASTYDLGKKYGVNRATISGWMIELGHIRGKGKGPAVERANKVKRDEADAKIIAEFGFMPESGKKGRQYRRELRMALRKRDVGVTWQALVKRNGSLVCEICGIDCDPNDKTWGTSGPTHPSVDHIIRIADGGEDTFDNARLVCCSCNLSLNAQAEKKVKVHAEEQAVTYKCA